VICKENKNELGLPWEIAKSFDHSAAIGTFISINEVADLQNLNFHLDINNENRTAGSIQNEMIYPVGKIISYISQFFTLKIGDLVFTGTPLGIGPVAMDDHLQGISGRSKTAGFPGKINITKT